MVSLEIEEVVLASVLLENCIIITNIEISLNFDELELLSYTYYADTLER